MTLHVKEYIDNCKKKYNWSNLLSNEAIKESISEEINIATKPFLHRLAGEGDIAAVKMALESGLDVNARDELGRTPIHDAVAANQIEMVNFLLDNGANIEANIKPFAHTSLYLAVELGHHDIAKLLIKRKARLYVTDRLTGRGLLHITAKNNDEKMASILIEAGANTLVCDYQGMTPRDIAAKFDYKELERSFLKVMQHHAMLLSI